MKLFTQARLKLTFQYMAILMVVTISFSVFVFAGLNNLATRAFENQRIRIERDFRMGRIPMNPAFPAIHKQISENSLSELRTRIVYVLTAINGGILLISGGLAYYLAGRTLKPIEEVHKKQKNFISDSAHELKTPVTALRTTLEVALRNKKISKEEVLNTLQTALEETINLQDLVTDLLKQSKFQNFNIEHTSHLSTIDIEKVLKSAIRIISPEAKAKNISVKHNLSPIRISADEKDVKELAVILLDNAVKFSKDGSTIEVSSGKENKFAFIEVKDSGSGISENDLPFIFDRFFKADSSRTENEGFGLGLSIAKEIAEKYKGKIDVKSQLGVGSTFKVFLPL